MPRPQRTPQQREGHYRIIAECLVKGWSQNRIAAYLEMSVGQISHDVKVVKSRWQAERHELTDQYVSAQILEIAILKEQAWDAWVRSCKPREKNMTRKAVPGNEEIKALLTAELRKEERDGNPAFLAEIRGLMERQAKLLGLDRPTRIDVNLLRAQAEEYARELGLDPAEVLAEAQSILKISTERG